MVCPVNVKIATPVPLTSPKIASEICNDYVLEQVFKYVHLGWPTEDKFKDNPAIHPYFKLRDSITIVNKCLMFSTRVIIPCTLQKEVLKALHEGHPGIVRSKLLAKMYVWWPFLGVDLTQMSSSCSICALVNYKSEKVFIPWPQPKGPFERVHIDFYEKRSKSYLIVCDSFSKWLHVAYMPTTTASQLIIELMSVFAMFGPPKYLVSDNGQPFDLND
ncbi:hypothetical protein KUF71_008333 [Frankliniella fusca]|uniref:RNA-directed DNA polymerase n=1 Tax=Frankliniella fusca TaxID=407009 RepID=A0AAE1HCY6_9NEOP|nr:hypothetical protein KUF71_008333 [Frankliniella fusca]